MGFQEGDILYGTLVYSGRRDRVFFAVVTKLLPYTRRYRVIHVGQQPVGDTQVTGMGRRWDVVPNQEEVESAINAGGGNIIDANGYDRKTGILYKLWDGTPMMLVSTGLE